MNKKMLHRALAAIMAFALILTNSGIASAAKQIKVKSIYTNFEKVTLATGETQQIVTETAPKNATNQNMKFSSSNTKIATVSKKGLIKAVSPGTVKLTVTAKDGSAATSSLKITVLKNLTIAKKNVISGKVSISNKNYGNVTISKSVGNATISLKSVTIKRRLSLEDGTYHLNLINTNAKQVTIDKAKSGSTISSMALDTSSLHAPTISFDAKSNTKEISVFIDAMITQSSAKAVQSLAIIQKYSDSLDTIVNGFQGKLTITAAPNGKVNGQFENSKVKEAFLTGGIESLINLTGTNNSTVTNLTVDKQTNLGLGIPTTNLLISNNAVSAAVSVNETVGTLSNNGSGSKLTIASTVNSITSSGANASISVAENGNVAAATLAGASSTLSGAGKVTEVIVSADNCNVNTQNTIVKIGSATGTVVRGTPVNAGQTNKPSTAPTTAPTSAPTTAPAAVVSGGTGGGTSGGGIIVTKAPTATIAPTATTAPIATAAPTTGPAITVPAGTALDLSTVTTIRSTTVGNEGVDAVYNATTKQITAKNVNIFKVTLPNTVSTGEIRYFKVSGSYNGTKGFRSWFSDNGQSSFSPQTNVANSSTAIPLSAGNFTITYKLQAYSTASDGKTDPSVNVTATTILFKGPVYGTNIEDLTINSITMYTSDPDAVTQPTPTTDPTQNWVATWSSAQQGLDSSRSEYPPAPGLNNNTLRQTIRISNGGSQIRLTFSNQYGTTPLVLNSVHIAKPTGYGTSAIDSSTDTKVTFNGSESVSIPAGKTMTSDLVNFNATDLQRITVSTCFGSVPVSVTSHTGARTTTFLTAGNHVSDASLSNTSQNEVWYFLSSIDVIADTSSKAIACMGDSLTDGRGVTVNYDTRWTDILANRLQVNASTTNVSVLNEGIGGTGVLGTYGLSATARFKRDVLDQLGVKYAIIFDGINDIGYATNINTADQIIAAYKDFITQAHAKGIKIYGATILPFKGSSYYDTANGALREQIRQKVNAWIRTPGNFDGVIDFDAVIRDTTDPEKIPSIYNYQSDGLHLNAAGYQKLGEAIDLSLFTN